MTQQISSPQNPLIKDVLRLMEKGRERTRRGLFVAEGRREVSLAMSKGYKLENLLVCPELYKPDPDYPIGISTTDPSRVFSLSATAYNKLAYRNNAEGVIIVAHPPSHSLESLEAGKNPLILVLENIEKPGNLGAMLRTCDAAGVDAVIICQAATDIYNPNIIRSSLGCLFTQNIACGSVPDVIAWLKKNKVTAYAASPDADSDYSQKDYTGPSAFVFGSESMGLSSHLMNALDNKISIPMSGMIDSLNVSVSAAVILFEAIRQRRLKGLMVNG